MSRFVLCTLVLLLPGLVGPVAAQIIPDWDSKQFRLEQLDSDRIRLTGQVEIEGQGPNAGQKFFADELEWNLRSGEFNASGNVVVSTPTSRIAAERAVFNTKTRLGTFSTASGIASLGERGAKDQSMFGALEPEVYFYGETIEKIGDDKYRITRGGFTTCVQPTPRWEVVTNKATINLGDYAILRNAVMRVKDVPIFYLPVLYYPIQDDDRATGFLLPTYGNSTYRGSSISNAFFWAINRSQDVTVFHDWFMSRGQGMGSEYRYTVAPGSEGTVRGYWLKEKASSVGGVTDPARRSYQIESGVVHRLPAGLSARGRIDYFSDVTTQQLYNNNIYEQSRSQRTINGSVSGSWSGLSATGTFLRSEQFFTPTDSLVNGNAPSLTANLSSRRLGGLPLYFSLNTESARVLYIERAKREQGSLENDFGLGRVDLNPQLRAPLTSLPFLALTGTVSYRYTYYSERRIEPRVQVPDPITRQYADLRAELVGPVLSRVFSPNNRFADRLKHLVEPNLSVQRTTSIDNFDQIPNLGGYYDTVFGGVTRVNYGLTNRFLARRTAAPGAAPAASAPREFLSMNVNQSYYSDARASQYDPQYQSNIYGSLRASNFSPVALTVRTTPTTVSTAALRLEYDHVTGRVPSLGVQGGLNHPTTQVTLGWSRSRQVTFATNVLDAGTTLKFAGGRTGGAYSLNWDIGRGYVVQQRWIGFYNAQCCGLTVEYQQYNFASDPRFLVPQDRRFNIGFTLAGVGTFSNFFGTFGGSRY